MSHEGLSLCPITQGPQCLLFPFSYYARLINWAQSDQLSFIISKKKKKLKYSKIFFITTFNLISKKSTLEVIT